MAIARAVSAHNTLPELPDINCPALVIGGRRDTTTPFRHAERIARTLPCAKLVPHPGTHYLMFEDPSIWYEILAFLEET
jgi:pimeloyl-ACP methyl ester carboxylesterase